MKIYRCDRCGKEKEHREDIHELSREIKLGKPSQPDFDFDLCESCMSTVERMIRGNRSLQ
jgi:hypothetical protein